MPQTVYDVGDTIVSRLKLGVTPDETTQVSVEWRKPTGAAEAATSPAGPVNGDEWTSQITTSTPGDYVAVWTVPPGTGAGVQAKVYNVRALPDASDSRPDWAPFLSDVADYIPRLTVDMVTPGSAIEFGTFVGGVTTPSDEQAMRLIDKAVASVVATVGTVQPALTGLANTVASLRAAAAIQRAYSRSSSDQSIANDLDKRADAETARLLAANAAAGASTPEALLPVYSFPQAPSWGDVTFL